VAILKIEPKQLRRNISPELLPFETTEELEPLSEVIGQRRALKALELALEIDSHGYNVFVTGMSGTGRTTIVREILNRYAANRPIPDDWCYVYNFEDPDAPIAINLSAGRGRAFQKDMEQLIITLKREIEQAFSSENYQEQKMLIVNRANEQKRKLLQKLDEEARQLGIQIQATPMGFQTTLLKPDNTPLKPEEYDKLSDEEKEQINQKIQYVETRINETVRALAKLDMEVAKSIQTLSERVAKFVVEQYVNQIKEEYEEFPKVLQYLDNVSKDIINHIHEFLAEIEKEKQMSGQERQKPSHFQRYKVNVVVDNSRLKGAPVIHETNPTYNNLFGRIEKHAVLGTYITDFTMIKAGSLLKANGGYLMADATQILRSPFVYDALKRAIRNREIRIEDVSELYGFLSPATIKPDPIPLSVKVILIGWSYIYYLLENYDEDFSKIFKIRADFDYETEANQDSIVKYAQFIKRVINEEKLLPFHKSAVMEIIQYGHRLVEDQRKLSLKFGSVVNILREASFWAQKDGKNLVEDSHIKRAISEYEYRHSLYEEKIEEMIERDIYRIQTTGAEVGQINGLSIYTIGTYVFGRPNRITAKTYIGNENVVNIERKVQLSGKIHDKGVLILSGFFNWKFGSYIPLSFSASITFEQSYSRIDGDSASSTELYALISSLAGVPIKQGIAVTGSVNQNGEIQAIGGVNQKIEGFFKVCQAKGLTGDQGVIIPKSNLEHLMQKDEVIKAVQQNKFHNWAVETVEDGLEILTGMKAGERDKTGKFPKGTIYYRVEEQLKEFARRAEEFQKKLKKGKEAAGKKKPKKSREEKKKK